MNTPVSNLVKRVAEDGAFAATFRENPREVMEGIGVSKTIIDAVLASSSSGLNELLAKELGVEPSLTGGNADAPQAIVSLEEMVPS